MRFLAFAFLLITAFCVRLLANDPQELQSSRRDPISYQNWENGISNDSNYFPIGVWLQAPRNAEKYRKAGINLYVGLWKGPSDEQLQMLKEANMKVICADGTRHELEIQGGDCWMDAWR